MGFPDVSDDKESVYCKRPRFDPCVRKIPWRRAWQPTPGFLSGKFHVQRSLASYSLCGPKEMETTEQITLTFFNQLSLLFFKLLNIQIQNKIILATVGRGHVYLWLIHIVVWQKPMQHGKGIILQLKNNK